MTFIEALSSILILVSDIIMVLAIIKLYEVFKINKDI